MKLKALDIKGTSSYLIKNGTIDNYINILLNGKSIDNLMKRSDMVISSLDKLTYDSGNKSLLKYRRDDEIMTIEDYKSKPQSYCSETPEEDVLRAIANKKELVGFEPVYSESSVGDVELEIIGYIEDTKSEFISCAVTNKYSTNATIYTVRGVATACDEYKRLAEEYSNHANFHFEKDRNYLRFTKINNKYAFNDGYPFSEYCYVKNFTNLAQAQAEEADVRHMVKAIVVKNVFGEEPTECKTAQIISSLQLIKLIDTKAGIVDVIDALILDLTNYNNIKD